MKKAVSITGALLLVSVTIFGYSVFGDLSLISIPVSFIDEAPEPVTAEELSEQSDIQNRDDGLAAMEEANYSAALAYFTAISDDSSSVTNKSELVQGAALKYLTDILEKTDSELDYDNFEQAKNYLEEAMELLPDQQEIHDKYQYVLLREELYKISCEGDSGEVLKFIRDHSSEFSKDSYVAEVFAEYQEDYLNDVAHQVDNLIGQADYDSATQIISEAYQLVGEQKELTDLQKRIDDEKVSNMLTTLEENEQWRDLILYLKENPHVKDKRESLYNSAYSNYKDEIIEQVNAAVEIYDYQTAKDVLISAQDILYENEEFARLYEKYKDYSSNNFRFCAIVNDERIEIEDAYDIDGTQYANVIKIKHDQYGKTVVFRLPIDNFATLSGTLFICQEKNYMYDEEDEGTTSVSFYDDDSHLIKKYDGLSYMNSAAFDIPIGNVQYLTIEVQKTTSKDVILGIRDAYFN